MGKGNVSVVLGAQWGDEGKGKVVDALAENADLVVRFNGGANAGHTLWIKDVKYVTHVLPSGIVRPEKMNLIGPGVACDLESMLDEMKIADACGSSVLLDRSAPVVLSLHKLIDRGREMAAGKSAIGTTGRGIGPVFEDFWSRRGLRMGDLTSEARIAEKLNEEGYFEEKVALLQNLNIVPPTRDEIVDWTVKFIDMVKPRLADTRMIVADGLVNGQRILFEGAQGVLLDTFHGAQPYVTSSSCTAGAVAMTYGVYKFDRVIGIAKAYTTRVGGGSFPSEMDEETGEIVRKAGNEYGSTTGRPRRCGWLDLVALRYACRLGGITELAITKLDTLGVLSRIKFCTDYKFEGRAILPNETLTARVLREAVPVFCSESGWSQNLNGVRSKDELPQELFDYLTWIGEYVGVPIMYAGVGPEREQLVHFKK